MELRFMELRFQQTGGAALVARGSQGTPTLHQPHRPFHPEPPGSVCSRTRRENTGGTQSHTARRLRVSGRDR